MEEELMPNELMEVQMQVWDSEHCKNLARKDSGIVIDLYMGDLEICAYTENEQEATCYGNQLIFMSFSL